MPTPPSQRPLPPVDRREPAPTFTDGVFRVGMSQNDITPQIRIGRTAYGPDQRPAYGTYGRLKATCLIVDDGKGSRSAIVSVDLHAGFRWIVEQVGHRCADVGLTTDRIFLAASHTHSGPGPYYGHSTYDRVAGTAWPEQWADHFDIQSATQMVDRLEEALRAAVADLHEGSVGYATRSVWGISWNRSVDALFMTPPDRTDADPDDGAPPEGPFDWLPGQVRALARRINGGNRVPAFGEVFPSGERSDLEAVLPPEAILAEALRDDPELAEDATFLLELLEAVQDDQAIDDDPEAEADRSLERPRATLEDVMLKLVKRLRGVPVAGDISAAMFLNRQAKKIGLRDTEKLPHRGLDEQPGDRTLADARVHCIAARRTDGTPIGAIAFFGATSTLLGDRHPVYCCDAFGVAARQAERAKNRGTSGRRFVVGLAGGSNGDVNLVPRHLRVAQLPKAARRFHAATDFVRSAAKALGDALTDAVEAALQSTLGSGTSLSIGFDEIRPANLTPLPRAVSRRPQIGASSLAASEIGGGNWAVRLLGFREGRVRPLGDEYLKGRAQYPKVAVPRMEGPPDIMTFRTVRLRNGARSVVLVGFPAEVSTMLGTEAIEKVEQAIQARDGESHDVDVVVGSLVGDYAGYLGTPWEFIGQHYEGSSQLYGRNSGRWAVDVLAGLASGDRVGTRHDRAQFSGGMSLGRPEADPVKKKWPDAPSRLLRKMLRKGDSVLRVEAYERHLPDPDIGPEFAVVATFADDIGRDLPLWDGPRVALTKKVGDDWEPYTDEHGEPVTDDTHPFLTWADDSGTWLFHVVLEGPMPDEPLGLVVTPDVEVGERFRITSDGIEVVPEPALERAGLRGRGARAAWKETLHLYAHVDPEADTVVPLSGAASIEPEGELLGQSIDLFLDGFWIEDYPGWGPHDVLLTVEADHTGVDGEQKLMFARRFRVQRRSVASVTGVPIFRGLRVGPQGLNLELRTVNVASERDEKVLSALDSDAFGQGLVLLSTVQPGLAPLGALAGGLRNLVASRSENREVQLAAVGLDLADAGSGVRLRTGTYLVVQGDVTWSEWSWDVGRQRIVPASGERSFEHNYIVLRVARALT